MMRQLPNILTLARIFLAAAFLLCLVEPGTLSVLLAAAFFSLAVMTDFYDGYFAKKYGLTSNFGKIMDPIADKFLILSAFFMFVVMGFVPAWMFDVIFVREMFVTGTRLTAVRKGQFIAAERAGKFKTALQMTVIFMILAVLFLENGSGDFKARSLVIALGQRTVAVLMIATVLVTLISGLLYLWNNRKILFSEISFFHFQ